MCVRAYRRAQCINVFAVKSSATEVGSAETTAKKVEQEKDWPSILVPTFLWLNDMAAFGGNGGVGGRF